MPYLSKAQRARQNARQKWMTLKEALDHIQRVEKVDDRTAVKEIQLALAEGAVVASRPISDKILEQIGDSPTRGIPIASFIPPEDFWPCVWIDSQLGTIEEIPPNEEARKNYDSPQEIWVLKESILNIWKDTELQGPAIEAPMGFGKKLPLEYTGKTIDRKIKAAKKQIRPALQQFLADHPSQADVHVMHVLIQDQLGIGVPRKDFEAVLNEPEFKDHKRKRGRPFEK
jgi:hypothetical protein